MKRVFALLLVLCMTLPFAACPNNNNNGHNPDNPNPGDTSPRLDNVGEHNFNGEEFVVSMLPSYLGEIYEEEEKPDQRDDAILQRNNRMNNLFNVKITSSYTEGQVAEDHTNAVKRAINDGNVDFHVALGQVWLVGPIIMTGMLYDLRSEVPYVKDSIGKNDWWNPQSNIAFTLYGRQFVGVSDINMSALYHTGCLVFNKDMAEDNNVAKSIDARYNTLYDVVEGGDWTLDNMYKIVKDFWRDNPTSGEPNKVDAEDTFGLLSTTVHPLDLASRAAGIQQVINDGETTPELMTMTSTTVATIDAISSIWKSSGALTTYSDNDKKFAAGGGLFLTTLLGSLDGETLHEAEIDFGILPYPKGSKNQKTYLAGVNDSSSVIYAPVGSNDETRKTMIGALTEALAAETHRTVVPAYYDVILTHGNTRDEASIPMIDYIYKGRTYDLSMIHSSAADELRVAYNGTNVGLAYFTRTAINAGGSAADMWAGISDTMQKRLQALAERYEELTNY